MELHREMTAYFTNKMANLKKEKVVSKPVVQCINYMEAHLHTPIRIRDLADHVSLNPTYLAKSYFIRCFQKIKGMTPNEYVQRHSEENIDAANKQGTVLYVDGMPK